MWQERADYGHFFYRIPNGESAADAYDRISGFNESLWRSFSEEDFASVCVLVTHGLMTRVFLMKWYHFSVEYFEDLRNVNHCEFVVMKLNPESGKFILQNQLRTWSQLQREEMEAAAPPASPIPVRKRWGDCQDPVDAGGFERRQQQRRQNTADLFLDDAMVLSIEQATKNHAGKLPAISGHLGIYNDSIQQTETISEEVKSDVAVAPVVLATTRKHILSPSTQAIMNAGRDGGGSQSGAASEDDEANEPFPKPPVFDSDKTSPQHKEAKVNARQEKPPGTPPNTTSNLHPTITFPGMSSMAMALQGRFDGTTESASSPTRARADALGDQSDVDD